MDRDAGWAAHEITLTAPKAAGGIDELVLPCRWIEYVHMGGHRGPSHFLVSVSDCNDLTDSKWDLLTFHDAGGKLHRYAVKDATPIGNLKVRLTKVG